MEIDRAIEILDPTHREHYDGIEEVNEACHMGMEALQEKKAHAAEAAEDMTAEQREMSIYETAVEKYGFIAQIDQAIEEMAELTVALNKYKRFMHSGKPFEKDDKVISHVLEECADVEIMLNQLHVIFGDCSDWECAKLERLAQRLGMGGAAMQPVPDTAKYKCTRPEWDEQAPCPLADMERKDFQEAYGDKNPCAECEYGLPE